MISDILLYKNILHCKTKIKQVQIDRGGGQERDRGERRGTEKGVQERDIVKQK